MAFSLNSNNLRIPPDDSRQSIRGQIYVLIKSWKIQNYLSSYYVRLEISEEINGRENKMGNKRKWEIDLNFMRWMLW